MPDANGEDKTTWALTHTVCLTTTSFIVESNTKWLTGWSFKGSRTTDKLANLPPTTLTSLDEQILNDSISTALIIDGNNRTIFTGRKANTKTKIKQMFLQGISRSTPVIEKESTWKIKGNNDFRPDYTFVSYLYSRRQAKVNEREERTFLISTSSGV